jgi:hypothetical protein
MFIRLKETYVSQEGFRYCIYVRPKYGYYQINIIEPAEKLSPWQQVSLGK